MSQAEVKTDLEKNRIIIVLDGFFNEKKAKEAADETRAAIDKMQAQFDVINDIRNFKPTTQEGAAYIEATQKYAIEKGVRKIVRIVGEDEYNVGKLQFQRKAQSAGVDATYARSADEAHQILDR